MSAVSMPTVNHRVRAPLRNRCRLERAQAFMLDLPDLLAHNAQPRKMAA
jgi:hypothetical protein